LQRFAQLLKSNMLFRQIFTARANVWRIVLALLAASLSSAWAQTSTNLPVTNLLQLVTLLNENEKEVRDVQLEATVCAASDPSIGVVILKDDTGVESIELGAGQPKFLPGEKVRIDQKKCLLRRRDLGAQISAAPIADNNMVHDRAFAFAGLGLRAGRHPITVEWFNQYHDPYLEVRRWPPLAPSVAIPDSDLSHGVSNHVSGQEFEPGLQVEYFEGNWERVPDFDLLKPVKTAIVTNFNPGFRSHDELVGLRFTGFVKVPTNGYYSFSTTSADGSLLFVGDPAVKVVKAGSGPVPEAAPAIIDDVVSDPCQKKWVSVEGRVSSVLPVGKGLELELRSERNSLLVRIADAGSDVPRLLNSRVRVTGVASGVFNLGGRLVLGQLAVATTGDLVVLDQAPAAPSASTALLKIKQVQSLPIADAKRGLPVHIRGVVTSKGRPFDNYLTIQDNTRGIFVYLRNVSNSIPVCGDFYDIVGHSGAGNFAPVVWADEIEHLGKGDMPEPSQPAWSALVNGSMDIQWVALQGLVTDVQSNILSMLLPGGQVDVEIITPTLSNLDSFKKSVITVKGVLFAEWNTNREVRVGEIRIHNAGITMDAPAPASPFDAVLKTPRELLLFDAQASPFRRVKVQGQIVYTDTNQVFLMHDGTGLRIFPASAADVVPGDMVDVVGYPYIGGTTPLLREALLRKTGAAPLPPPKIMAEKELMQGGLDSIRVRVEGKLLGWHIEGGLPVLEMQSGVHLFFARLASWDSSNLSLRTGSRLALTGVYAAQGGGFNLLLNAPADITVLSQPSWWTLQRLLIVLGIMVFVLFLAIVWITQLHRLVEQRTTQLAREIRERELEAERSRIARDLHDDLGSSLTEIGVLASTGQNEPGNGQGNSATLFQNIANKSRRLLAALDVIVWAVDPEDNSLQSLADYLTAYAGEYLSSTNIACRFKVPISFPPVTLDGRVRHELLMTIKETLNNVVRHAEATEVEFRMAVNAGRLDITISDNGKGIQTPAERDGHGLKNLPTRMNHLGGRFTVESQNGGGTIVTVTLPLPQYSGAKVQAPVE
jgi:signal transduction histidine kinase